MIKLKQLHIKSDFKNINDLKIDFSKTNGVSLFIGNNGSGKSNVIEAISSIFAGLYNNAFNPEFSYELSYLKDDSNIVISYNHSEKKYETEPVKEHLPMQVISLYSGEELRLWERYFFKFYDTYNKEILQSKITVSENMPMLFLNKYHWDIALLTMLKSDLDISDILGGKEITTVHFKFDKDAAKNVKEFNEKNPNEVTRFALQILETKIGSIDDKSDIIDIELPIEIFKDEFIQTHTEFFKLLSVALLPREKSWKLISSVELWFIGGFKGKELSEGEKKLILIKFITRILADENSIFLLDEPDSHIHINNKKLVKKHLYNPDENPYVESILTTHSPSLTACFKDENLITIANGQLNSLDNKLSIIRNLVGDDIDIFQTDKILSKDIPLLIVEGKGDIEFINYAIQLYKADFEQLENLHIIPAGGAESAKPLFDQLQDHLDPEKQVIVLFDRDEAGRKGMKSFGVVWDNATNPKGIEDIRTYNVEENTYCLMLPKIDDFEGKEFVIEDYFGKNLREQYVSEVLGEIKSFNDIKRDIRQRVKEKYPKNYRSYTNDNFEGFKTLLNKLKSIVEKTEDFEILNESANTIL